jgi:hypothetical protein
MCIACRDCWDNIPKPSGGFEQKRPVKCKIRYSEHYNRFICERMILRLMAMDDSFDKVWNRNGSPLDDLYVRKYLGSGKAKQSEYDSYNRGQEIKKIALENYEIKCRAVERTYGLIIKEPKRNVGR